MLRYYQGCQKPEQIKFMYKVLRKGIDDMCPHKGKECIEKECEMYQPCHDINNVLVHIILDLLNKK